MSATHPRINPEFHLEVVPERDVVRVCPCGEVDLVTAGRIGDKFDELTSLGFRRAALDLGGVSFLDSTGVRYVASSHTDGGWSPTGCLRRSAWSTVDRRSESSDVALSSHCRLVPR